MFDTLVLAFIIRLNIRVVSIMNTDKPHRRIKKDKHLCALCELKNDTESQRANLMPQ